MIVLMIVFVASLHRKSRYTDYFRPTFMSTTIWKTTWFPNNWMEHI